MILKLTKPVTFGEKTLSEITLREPTIGEAMSVMALLTAEDHVGYLMSLIASVATIQFQFVEEMGMADINEASKFLQEFPLVPTLDFRGKKIQTPFRVPVTPTITHGNKALDCLEINDPLAKMVREANKLLTGSEFTLDKVQARNFKLVQLITGTEVVLLQRVPLTQFREAEEAALSFL